MAINYTNAILGVGVGGLDSYVENLDATAKNSAGAPAPRMKPFKRWNDWVRIGVVVAGLLGQVTNIMPKYAEPLAQSALPLATKSVIDVMLYKEPSGIPGQVNRMARVPAGVSSRVSAYQNINPRPKLV